MSKYRKWVGLILCLCLLLSGCQQEIPIENTKPTMPTWPTFPTDLPPNIYTREDIYFVDNIPYCDKADLIFGIDVSHHQGQIDWQAVAESGVQFVFVRLGYRSFGGRLYVDDWVEENLRGVREVGLKLGAYLYSQAISVEEAHEEAAHALEILGDTPLDLPLVFDWEQENRTKNVPVDVVTDCALAFCEDVEQAGYQPMVYFNLYQAMYLMDMSRLIEYPWWLAMYNEETEFPCWMDYWQYSCTGVVPGIEGYVDMNLMFPIEDW